MSGQPLQLSRKPSGVGERERLVRRAKLLAWLGVGWHGVEAAIAVGAGVVAGSIALAIRMIPPPVLAECREVARGAKDRPVSRAAAAVVVAVWLALAALAVWFVALVL